jgi:arsenate reductase-like glutaredoxin family protein
MVLRKIKKKATSAVAGEERLMELYGLKTCDTCRKALKILPEAIFVDVRAQGVPDDVMIRALARFGDDLVNARSTTWRGLTAQDRARPPSELLSDHPALMKRPLIVSGKQMWLGWTSATRAALGITP